MTAVGVLVAALISTGALAGIGALLWPFLTKVLGDRLLVAVTFKYNAELEGVKRDYAVVSVRILVSSHTLSSCQLVRTFQPA
jgi:hypothetical protein